MQRLRRAVETLSPYATVIGFVASAIGFLMKREGSTMQFLQEWFLVLALLAVAVGFGVVWLRAALRNYRESLRSDRVYALGPVQDRLERLEGDVRETLNTLYQRLARLEAEEAAFRQRVEGFASLEPSLQKQIEAEVQFFNLHAAKEIRRAVNELARGQGQSPPFPNWEQ